MRYFGGKKRIAKQIISFLKQYEHKTEYYFEPFVGSAVIVEGMSGKRFASDKNEYLIEMYKAIQEGWIPPLQITEDEYKYIKEHKDENKPLTAFVGFGLSFSGKWFGGYARDNRGDDYCGAAHRTLIAQKDLLKTVVFKSTDYKDCHPNNSLVYCDPPYMGTTQYGATGTFDTDEFWTVIRHWSKKNYVFVSEYTAPEDFKCVLEIPTKLEIRNKEGKREPRIEKLFCFN